jgi:hypothetical protein
MTLDSVRELKATIASIATRQAQQAPKLLAFRDLGVAARAQSALIPSPRTYALGVKPDGKHQFKLALRIQNRALTTSPVVEYIVKQARREIEIQHIGRVNKRTARVPWYRLRQRPLLMGASIGHHRITAGTLGGFVVRPNGTRLILSNNHVLANENDAARGDVIVQAGPLDGGRTREDRVARLARFVKLTATRTNTMDAAVAVVDEGIEVDPLLLTGLGRLAGIGPSILDTSTKVAKVGRTTGLTRGKVTAFELDGLTVDFDLGTVRFNNVIEIAGTGREPFSLGGDSGSLIVDDDRRAVGLLFAGSDQGGRNGLGLTFANPIHPILDAFGVDLLT